MLEDEFHVFNLDKVSLDKLDEKRRLAFKEGTLTNDEEETLYRLALETQDIEDPLYTHFVNAVVNHEDYLLLKKHYSTESQFTVLTRVAEKVRNELLRKTKTDPQADLEE